MIVSETITKPPNITLTNAPYLITSKSRTEDPCKMDKYILKSNTETNEVDLNYSLYIS